MDSRKEETELENRNSPFQQLEVGSPIDYPQVGSPIDYPQGYSSLPRDHLGPSHLGPSHDLQNPQNGRVPGPGGCRAADLEVGRFMVEESNHRVGRNMKNEYVDNYNTEAETTYSEAGASPLINRRRRSEDEAYLSQEEIKKQMNKRKRLVRKGGMTNVTYKNISKKRRKYISDLFTTLLDSSWAWLVLMFAASFYLTWILFAVLYYISCYYHGDLLPEHLPPLQGESGWTPCILEIDGFAASFLFSLETQHTIGYGSRQTTTECPDTMIMASIQSVLGCLIQAFMVGLVFSKLSRPGSRSRTVIFSQNAVITMRNRRLCLIFRIGDLRDDNFILGTQISAKVLRRRITQEGEQYEEMQKLNVVPDSSSEPCIFFVWPLEVVHIIDEESPFYDLSANDLSKEKFEIAVVMEGCIETTSMNFQARTSYLPSEILWGHRFEPMMLYRRDHNMFHVNFSAFDSTYEVQTPRCSARDLASFAKKDPETTLPALKSNRMSRTVAYPQGGEAASSLTEANTGPDSSNYGAGFIPRTYSTRSFSAGRKPTHPQLPVSPLTNSPTFRHQTRDGSESSHESNKSQIEEEQKRKSNSQPYVENNRQ